MKSAVQLLVIDPQNDFCDLPASHLGIDPSFGATLAPALPVTGAHQDMLRLAGLIRLAGAGIDDITITLDSHQRMDIAHPTFWRKADGSAVMPFTTISASQVRAGEFQPCSSDALPRTLAYLDELEARGRYTLMVWPVHCEIGSWGHNVHADLRAAYNQWEEQWLRTVSKVTKGENPWTEHYSAVQAEVPDTEDPHTQLNSALIAKLDRADMLLIAGEASSHCVRATTEHIVANLPSGRPERVVLLTDCMSPVTGFEAQHDAFLSEMQGLGVRLSTAAEVLPLIQASIAR
ncbi:cysteine hydrolase [Ideonella sp.]|uniref:cysteine hydrolase n=1 Tax=Ideonella sp. TaxID=1929293 RepID=UPI003BB604D4